MRSSFTLVLLAFPALLVGGCMSPRATGRDGISLNADGVRDRAAFDLNCPKGKIEVVDLDGRDLSFGATGCGKRAAYVWKGSTVVLNSQIVEAEGTNR